MAVVENMSYFDGDDGKRYYPFGRGSGDRIVRDFGLPNLVRFPIVAGLSAAGDGAGPNAFCSAAAPHIHRMQCTAVGFRASVLYSLTIAPKTFVINPTRLVCRGAAAGCGGPHVRDSHCFHGARRSSSTGGC